MKNKNWGKIRNFIMNKKEYDFKKEENINIFNKEIIDNIIVYNIDDDVKIYIDVVKNNTTFNELKNNVVNKEIDSTGLTLWPSEEILAYHIFKNFKEYFKNNNTNYNVLELGAGYNGLASIVIYKLFEKYNYNNYKIHITDGNKKCVTC